MFQSFLITIALWSFSVAQPIFDLLERTPEFLVIRRANLIEVFSMILVLGLAAPVMIAAFRVLLMNKMLQRAFDFVIFSLLGSALGLLLNHSILIAVIVGLLIGGFLSVSRGVQNFFRFLSAAAILFPVLFLVQVFSALSPTASNTKGTTIVDSTKVRPTFVMVFDEFPLFVLLNAQDQINEKRYPGFAELAKNSTWFKNASVLTSWTERAVPSVLSGIAPDVHRTQMPSLKDYPNNIFSLFARSHKVEGFEQVTSLCASNICSEVTEKDPYLIRMRTLLEDLFVLYLHRVLPRSYSEDLPSIEGKFEGFIKHVVDEKSKKNHRGLVIKDNRGDDVAFFKLFLSHMKREIPGLLKRGVSPLYVIHITFPHVPYRYLPDGKKYFLDRDSNNDREFVTKWDNDAEGASSLGMQRLAMQTGVVDSLVSEFLETLRTLNILDRSAFVVTADHGSSFIPGEPARAITQNNFVDIMSVPLFVSLPGENRNGEINTTNVLTVDVLPTLLELNGINPGSAITFEGSSLISRERPKARTDKEFFPLQGSKERLSFPPVLDRKNARTRYVALFGEGGFDERFYTPHIKYHELLGQTLEEKDSRIDQRYGVAVHGREKYFKVALSPTFHRCAVSGFVRARNGERLEDKRYYLAITVNNKVVAITETERPRKGHANYIAIIPPHRIKEGRNEVNGIVLK